MADDDADDREMTKEAFEMSRLANDLRCAVDGVDLMDYLKRRGKYTNPSKCPRPGIILLDLNMPKKDGREALAEIREDSELTDIPVIVLTTSQEEEDIQRSYSLHANSYITKPVTFEGLVSVVGSLGRYWFEIVELPRR